MKSVRRVNVELPGLSQVQLQQMVEFTGSSTVDVVRQAVDFLYRIYDVQNLDGSVVFKGSWKSPEPHPTINRRRYNVVFPEGLFKKLETLTAAHQTTYMQTIIYAVDTLHAVFLAQTEKCGEALWARPGEWAMPIAIVAFLERG